MYSGIPIQEIVQQGHLVIIGSNYRVHGAQTCVYVHSGEKSNTNIAILHNIGTAT